MKLITTHRDVEPVTREEVIAYLNASPLWSGPYDDPDMAGKWWDDVLNTDRGIYITVKQWTDVDAETAIELISSIEDRQQVEVYGDMLRVNQEPAPTLFQVLKALDFISYKVVLREVPRPYWHFDSNDMSRIIVGIRGDFGATSIKIIETEAEFYGWLRKAVPEAFA
jgi:hypothetical protein